MMKNKCVIRVATKADLDLLPDLEDRADQAYKNMPRFAPMFEREGLTIEQCHNLPPSSQVWLCRFQNLGVLVPPRFEPDKSYYRYFG